MREYVKIYCCGDCAYYNRNKRKCSYGARDEGEAQDHFYRDCPLGIHIEQEPTVDAEPVRHGKWLFIRMGEDGNGLYECSLCHKGEIHVPQVKVDYCWNCGAKMESEEE